MDELIYGCDSPENVQICLSCTRPKCTNCLSYGGPENKRVPQTLLNEVREELIALIRQGVRQRDIAKQLGVSDSTISRWACQLREEGAL